MGDLGGSGGRIRPLGPLLDPLLDPLGLDPQTSSKTGWSQGWFQFQIQWTTPPSFPTDQTFLFLPGETLSGFPEETRPVLIRTNLLLFEKEEVAFEKVEVLGGKIKRGDDGPAGQSVLVGIDRRGGTRSLCHSEMLRWAPILPSSGPCGHPRALAHPPQAIRGL